MREHQKAYKKPSEHPKCHTEYDKRSSDMILVRHRPAYSIYTPCSLGAQRVCSGVVEEVKAVEGDASFLITPCEAFPGMYEVKEEGSDTDYGLFTSANTASSYVCRLIHKRAESTKCDSLQPKSSA